MVGRYGADATRMYALFAAPPDPTWTGRRTASPGEPFLLASGAGHKVAPLARTAGMDSHHSA